MGEGLIVRKPSRSDEVADAEEQSRILAQIKSQFEAIAPKRHRKPDRSEYSDGTDVGPDCHDASDEEIPEFKKFEELQSHSEPLPISPNGNSVPEEFVETEYYRDLNSVDKQHHTPGNGYIKLECNGGSYFRLAYEDNGLQRIPIRSNPATNDWLPALEDPIIPVSLKPSRSDLE